MAKGKKGSAKDILMRVAVFIFLMGVVVAWARVANVKSAGDALDYARGASKKIDDCGWDNLEWNCGSPIDVDGELKGGDGQEPTPAPKRTFDVPDTEQKDDPLLFETTAPDNNDSGDDGQSGNPSGDGEAGKFHVEDSNGNSNDSGDNNNNSDNESPNQNGGDTSGSMGSTEEELEKIGDEVSQQVNNFSFEMPDSNSVNVNAPDAFNSPKELLDKGIEMLPSIDFPGIDLDYKKDEWSHWKGEPCDARIETLRNKGENVVVDESAPYCEITSGQWADSYTGKRTANPNLLDVDHIVPIPWAASHGGKDWSQGKKEAFANDLDNLAPVLSSVAKVKDNRGPSEYMPNDEFKCGYSRSWSSILLKYGLSASEEEKAAIKDGLASCEG